MADQFSFQFGVEIELLIGSRSKTHKSWKSLAMEVSSKLSKAGVHNHVNENNDKTLENYQEWSIVQEVTVPTQAGRNLWGLELVSPIFDPSSSWASHLALVFKTLKSSFTISSSANTSTHIHLSTVPPLPPTYLAAISKAILYFEPAIDSLLPSSRSSAYWCQRNRVNPALKSLTLPQCFEHLDYCATTNDIIRSMCLYPARSAYGRANGYTEDFVHGVYKWDFSGLDYTDPSANGTLEFRQCPGSRSSDEASTWIELAVGFTAGAIEGVGMLDPEGKATMEELWWLLGLGMQGSGIGDMSAMERLFVGGKKDRGSKK